MLKNNFVSRYQQLIAERFPEAVFRADLGGPGDLPVLDVFCVPDERMQEFLTFRTAVLRQHAEAERLPCLSVLGHSASATKEYYPEVWTQVSSQALPAAEVVLQSLVLNSNYVIGPFVWTAEVEAGVWDLDLLALTTDKVRVPPFEELVNMRVAFTPVSPMIDLGIAAQELTRFSVHAKDETVAAFLAPAA